MVWSKIYYVGIEFGKNSKYRGKTNSAPGTIKKKEKHPKLGLLNLPFLSSECYNIFWLLIDETVDGLKINASMSNQNIVIWIPRIM